MSIVEMLVCRLMVILIEASVSEGSLLSADSARGFSSSIRLKAVGCEDVDRSERSLPSFGQFPLRYQVGSNPFGPPFQNGFPLPVLTSTDLFKVENGTNLCT